MAGGRDELGDRMKAYERRETAHAFTAFAPVVARMDGRAFGRWTGSLGRPYDDGLGEVMVEVTRHLVRETGARIGYTQSDEITLVMLADEVDAVLPFGGRAQKLCSVLAAMTTASFITTCLGRTGERIAELALRGPHFDARVFQVPTRSEASNALLWRERDAVRNAIHAAARATRPHAAVQGRTGADLLREMAAADERFDDLPAAFRRGVFVQRRSHDTGTGSRARVEHIAMPPFDLVANRDAVVFDGAHPVARNEGEGA